MPSHAAAAKNTLFLRQSFSAARLPTNRVYHRVSRRPFDPIEYLTYSILIIERKRKSVYRYMYIYHVYGLTKNLGKNQKVEIGELEIFRKEYISIYIYIYIRDRDQELI